MIYLSDEIIHMLNSLRSKVYLYGKVTCAIESQQMNDELVAELGEPTRICLLQLKFDWSWRR